MFKNYISVALRNLIKNKLYSAINIIGLAIGLAACVLIALFVRDEFSYDTQWAKAEQLYRMNTTFEVPGREPFVTVMAPGPAKEALKRYFPEEIDQVTRFNRETPVIEYEGEVFTEPVTWTDPETASMFDLDLIAGDMQQTLTDNASIAINESFARKYFGDENALGKVLTLTFYATTRDYRVGAIFKDLPHNTVLDFQALVMIDEKDFENFRWEYAHWFSVNNNIFFTLKDGIAIDLIDGRWTDFTNTVIEVGDALDPGTQASDVIKYSSQSILDMQLHPAGAGEMKPTGNITTVMTFIAIAGLILLVACINFMNLATAKSTQRAKEVALRKVMGAHRGQLILQFMGESIFLALIGLVLGIVLIEMVLPTYSDFIGKELTFELLDPTTLATLVGLVVAVGFIGGLYPALAVSGFRPARILKANKSAETSGSLSFRNLLVIIQFAISTGLMTATAVVYGQMLFGLNMDPGYKKENMLILDNIGRRGTLQIQENMRQEILRMPGVKNASLTMGSPADGNENNNSVELPDNPELGSILLGYQAVDHEFLDTYQIPLLAGRDYDKERLTDGTPWGSKLDGIDGVAQGTIIINEMAVGRLGFASVEDALGKTVEMGERNSTGESVSVHMEIIGVIPNVHFQSLKTVLRPELYALNDSYYGNLTVSFEGNPQALIDRIETLWKQMAPSVPFHYEFVADNLSEEFESESATATILGAFAALAITIACLGLYGLASFTAERRTKEIGIRKVMGASVIDIVRLLIWQFSKPVLLANLIAWPIAVYGILQWLENFPYRIETWWLGVFCLIAAFVALTIAWITVGGNAAKVARSNPIKALRYE